MKHAQGFSREFGHSVQLSHSMRDAVDEIQHELEEGEPDKETEGAAHGGQDPAQVEDLVLCVHCDVAPLDLGAEPAQTGIDDPGRRNAGLYI